MDDVERQSQARRPAELAWPLLPNPPPLGWPFVRVSRHTVDVVTGGACEDEGWRFRLGLEDPCDDLRPDAEMIAVSAPHAQEVQPMSGTAGVPTIDEALAEFLVEQEKRLAPRTFRNYADVIHLLRDCLNGYGHQSLDADERRRWESVYERDEEAFVHVFGPAKIADNLGEFLDYFMIRKVMAGEELLRAAGTVTKKLAKMVGRRRLPR